LEKSLDHFRKGDVVAVAYPFSDSLSAKKRPALIIAESDVNNVLACPITSKPGREYEIKPEDKDFGVGKLDLSPCYIRPNIIATIAKSAVTRRIGNLKDAKVNAAIAQVIAIIEKPSSPPSTSAALERGKRPKP
jgi:mRNA interferase MazF